MHNVYIAIIKNKRLIDSLKKDSKKIQDKVEDWCKKLNVAGYKINFNNILKKYPKARGNINEFYPLYELALNGYGTTRKIGKELRDKKIRGKKIKEMSIIKGIRLIKGAGGVPVLAHPWLNDEILKTKNFEF